MSAGRGLGQLESGTFTRLMSIFLRIWKTPELRKSVLFVTAMLIVFRIAAHIPVPGIDATALQSIFQQNQLFGLLNIFSGGTLSNFSVVALGVAPFITASIIFQLLGMIIPSMEEMQKEESGRQKINKWTRYLAVPLSLLQAYALVLLFRQQAGSVFQVDLVSTLLAMLCMTAGTIFLMWIGELMSEEKIGNGMSILIFAGIIAGLPGFLAQSLAVYDQSQLVTTIIFAVLVLLTILGVVIMNEAQRNMPIQYARQTRGSRLGGAATSSLPLRLNMAGVIPVIFAISIILFPTVLAQFFLNARTLFLREAAQWIIQLFANQLVYGIVYFVLVFAFSYFYTSVIFHPEQVAENLQKQGGFIPGVRPGTQTAEHLSKTVGRLLFAGALFLAVIAILPLIVQKITGNANIVIGGTSMLIVVSVVIDMVKQIQAQLTMREYEI